MPGHDQTILIVDDTELNRSLLQDILGPIYNTIEATNGVEALEILDKRQDEISLVLLDVIMPQMDGFEVLARMNHSGVIESIPVIMISAETAPESINRGYELGVVDYINRPFDAGIIKRRIYNTIMLYAKQKNLEKIVTQQIAEKEKNNTMMVDILSTIVEFRNGESGAHVRRIRVITELLLEAMVNRFPQYSMPASKIAIISNAAALHDVGKISIPEEILNKPGRLNQAEYEIMKTHAKIGADMLSRIPFAADEELVKYAHSICLSHHERWDGSGYPQGLVGSQIPVEAQVVALADVYDALVSERAYKPAYTSQKAVSMILNGECGPMNPDLLYCLALEGDELEARIETRTGPGNSLVDIDMLSQELLSFGAEGASDRTVSLLEREQTKYRFLASLSQEILFDFNMETNSITFSEKGYEELGLEAYVENALSYLQSSAFLSPTDIEDLAQRTLNTDPDKPVIQMNYIVNTPNNGKRWYEIIMRTMWSNDLVPKFLGCIGKLQDVHNQRTETFKLRSMAERDSLTHLLNHSTARRLIENSLREEPSQNAALLFIDVDNFKTANDTFGHVFGDTVLQYVSEVISTNIRNDDIAARVGGDEFLIFLHNIKDIKHVEQQAKRICSALNDEYNGYHFSISVGVAVYPTAATTYTDLLTKADQALYLSKKAGKNRYAFYSTRQGGQPIVEIQGDLGRKTESEMQGAKGAGEES